MYVYIFFKLDITENSWVLKELMLLFKFYQIYTTYKYGTSTFSFP